MKFQDAAAHLLAVTCPSTSAHLQQEFNQATIKAKIDLNHSRKHQICESCGTLLKSQDTRMHGKVLVSKCHPCGAVVKSEMEPNPRLLLKHKAQLPSPTASTHKRQTRSKTQAQKKKSSSLQAMLAKSKSSATSTTSFGINLMDLMKS